MAARKRGAAATSARDRLARYREKRAFDVTPEPSPGQIRKKRNKALAFVVQKHDARRLHYDVRLEIEGTMASFAVPKGPSYDPSVKRLAVETEDHPIEYNAFEGTIPEGEYGAGDVIVWDRGTYETVPAGEEAAMRAKGHLHVRFEGEKLRGEWHFVRTRRPGRSPQWLMFKAKDALADARRDPTAERPESVLTGERLPRDRAVRRAAPAAAARSVRRAGGRATTTVDAILRRVGEVEKATLVRELEDASRYLFEIKYDGYRIVAVKSGRDVRLVSRNGHDWTERFPKVAAAVAALRVREIALDGEVCALDARGRPSFNLLQNVLGSGRGATLTYPVFDVLWLEGRDLRGEPIEARHAALAEVLEDAAPPLARSTVVAPEGRDADALLRAACDQGLEGLIAKRRGSRYVAGRTRDWLKLKCTRRQELAIVGYLPLTRTTNRVGSLLLAVAEGRGFRYAGKVGTGFDARARRELAEALDAHRIDEPPAADAPRSKTAHWSSPRLVAEIELTEWTPDGKIRHPSFVGLRADKSPRECVRETPAEPPAEPPSAETSGPSAGEISLTNPDKVLYPRDGITKRDVLEHYVALADVILPHLRGRPVVLQRWPDGIDGESWFQHAAPRGLPAFVRTVPVADRRHVVVDDVETLAWLANLAALTLHQWSSRVPASAKAARTIERALDRPDYLVLDLDPGEGTWDDLLAVTKEVRRVLEDLEVPSVPKTSGKRGLHVMVPIRGGDHALATEVARALAERVARALPAIATVRRAKAARRGRLYVDALQNGRGKTVVAPYSLRAVDGAPVSTPLAWSEVGRRLDPRRFGPREVRRRVDRHGDLLAPLLEPGVNLRDLHRRLA